MPGKKLVCKSDQHNKFWEYDISGLTVTIKWGRIGGGTEQQVKTFDSASELNDFVAKKMREKMKKGYVETTSEELREDVKVAETMGFRYKISKLQFVKVSDASLETVSTDLVTGIKHVGSLHDGDVKLTFLPAYDPKQYIYAQVLDSWSKEVTTLLLNKVTSCVFDQRITHEAYVVGTRRWALPSSFAKQNALVAGVRLAIKKLTAAVVETYQRLQLGVMGARVLDDSQFAENLDMQELANSTGATNEAVSSFASGLYATGQVGSLGVRVIDW